MSDLLAWLALGVAVIAIPVAIWTTRQWGNRRARIDVSVTSTPILPGGTGPGLLEVTYGDIPVMEPHLVSVTLRNTGPRDLASGTFDGGRSVEVRFDQTFYGLTDVHGGARTLSPAIGTPPEGAVVSIQPGLLKRGDSWAFSAVTTGPVKVSIDAPLIDTDVRILDPSALEARRDLTVTLSVLGLTVGLPVGRVFN